MRDPLEFLSQPHPELGIPEAPNLDQKSPIILGQMKRAHLAALFRELGYRVGAEIGVSLGKYSKCLSVHNPEATIYSIDPWVPYPGYAESLSVSTEEMEEIFQEAKKRLENTGCIIIRRFSMNAVREFEDGELDFVYIDGNHQFQHVTNDIAEWSKKVRRGGIVSGHDFTRYKRNPPCHVRSVVGAWTYSHKINPWFVARGQHGSSWFWVKDAY
jgi:predicted O-methyltransferase YrrM